MKNNTNIIKAVLDGRNLIRDGYYIINIIGMTTYISFDHLTSKELYELAKLKEQMEGGGKNGTIF